MQLRALAAARSKAAALHDGRGDAVLGAQLQLVGSCRNAEDEARITQLKGARPLRPRGGWLPLSAAVGVASSCSAPAPLWVPPARRRLTQLPPAPAPACPPTLAALAEELGIAEQVAFHVNVPWQRLAALLGDAVAGLHTMVDEHFGISVVEYMAAGGCWGGCLGAVLGRLRYRPAGLCPCLRNGCLLGGGCQRRAECTRQVQQAHRPPPPRRAPPGVVPIAHDSAGPREDIVLPEQPAGGGPAQPTGYRCRSLPQYADALIEVLCMEQRQRMRVAAAARRRAAQFSDQRFQKEFMACMEEVLPLGRGRSPPSNVLPPPAAPPHDHAH